MKKIFLLVFGFTVFHSLAQKNGKIVLTKGRKITAVSTGSIEADMGMGMQMKNTTSSTNMLVVLSEDEKNYSISSTLTKQTESVNAMGEETSYDSEKPGDKDSDLGKEFSGKLNIPDTLQVDKTSGDVSKKKSSPERPEKTDETNPLAGIFSSIGGDANTDIVLNSAFFIMPAGKKAGDTWTDSTTEKNMKNIKIYKIKSIEKNVATIIITGSITGHGETEMQGSTIPFDMSTTSNGEMIVDISTGLVSSNINNAEITMTMEVMGQAMPVTSKINSTVSYQ